MGCGDSRDAPTREIDGHMALEKRKDEREKKLLLLGVGSSGKSTFFRQVEALKKGEAAVMTQDRLTDCQRNVRSNMTECAIILLSQYAKRLAAKPDQYGAPDFGVPSTDTKRFRIVQELLESPRDRNRWFLMDFSILSYSNPEEMTLFGETLAAIWASAGIQEVFHSRHNRFSLYENMEYFFAQCETVFSTTWRPTTQDVLLTRIKTNGVITATISWRDSRIALTDVAGQRSERRKWLQAFNQVTAVCFVGALNHYSHMAMEDETVNSMLESLRLFREIVESKYMRRTEVILLLNKRDLLFENIKFGKSLSMCFSPGCRSGYDGPSYWESDYSGPKSPDTANECIIPSFLMTDELRSRLSMEIIQNMREIESEYKDAWNETTVPNMAALDDFVEKCTQKAAKFIESLYRSRLTEDRRSMIAHQVSMLDTDGVGTVVDDVMQITIKHSLRRAGLLVE